LIALHVRYGHWAADAVAFGIVASVAVASWIKRSH
jgi:hypothetical protein